MNIQEAGKSKKIKIVSAVLGVILIALASFAAGISVGFNKAKFSGRFGENYEKNFMGSRPDMKKPMGSMGKMKEKFKDMEGHNFRNAHGLAGTIISISENSLAVKDRDGKENIVAITDKTLIKSGRNDVEISELKAEDKIAVMGRPDENGTIQADLIRVFKGQGENGISKN